MADAIHITTVNKTDILKKITGYILEKGYDIVYTQYHVESKDESSLYVEIENVKDLDNLISELMNFSEVIEIVKFYSTSDVWGKRVIIIGTGVEISQVVLGAITEADRHNIRGERISIDTLPITGDENLVEVLESIECLPRVACIVLADMSISNSLCNVIAEIKNKYNIRIISLNVSDCLSNHVDLVVTDAVQAGVMAVMAIAETSNLDIDRIKEVL